jgi:hypothetical protein
LAVMLLGAKGLAGDRALAACGLGAASLPRRGIVGASRALELPVGLGAAAGDVRKTQKVFFVLLRGWGWAMGLSWAGAVISLDSPALPGRRSG